MLNRAGDLERLLKELAPAVFKSFIAWERAGLQDLLPGRWLAWASPRRAHLLLHPQETGVLVRASDGVTQSPHRFIPWSDYSRSCLDASIFASASGVWVGIVLPSKAVFLRTFALPARAFSRLVEIGAKELEYRTPFKPQDILQACTCTRRPNGSDPISVEQRIVKRQLVEEAATSLHLDTSNIHFAIAADGTYPSHAIMLHQQGAEPRSKIKRAARALMFSAGLILMTDLSLFWVVSERELSAVEQESSRLRAKAVAIGASEEAFRRKILSAQSVVDRRTRPSVLGLWREATRSLPDDSWLTDLRIGDGTVSMSGLSSHAADLVTVLDRSPLFGDARLDAPVTTDSILQRERFTISAKLSAGKQGHAQAPR